MPDIDISVIIVNYNSANLVSDCIDSVFEKTSGISYEIIVVDNASSDGSVDTLEKKYKDKIKTIASDENLGFGRANNLGNGQARGKFVFLLNPDTLLINNAIKILYDYMESDPGCGVAGGNLYLPDMTPAPSYCTEFDSLELEKKRSTYKSIISDKLKRGKKEVSFNQTDAPIKVAYIFGADMMMKKSVFDDVGGFDPDFFMYAEEEELTYRITQKGYSAICVPQAKIIHLEGATQKKSDEFSPRNFKTRMTGTMTYFYKRYGTEGVREFYRLRSKRYKKYVTIAKLKRKLTDDYVPLIQIRCLTEAYSEFIKKTGEK